MTKMRFVLLLDFSPYSELLLRLVDTWSALLRAEVMLVHRVSDAVPVMADPSMKTQVVEERRKESKDALRRMAAEFLTRPVIIEYDVTERNLVEELPLLGRGRDYYDVVMVGLKGSNFFKKYLLGSTAAAVIEQLESVVIAVPEGAAISQFDTLHFAVSPHYPFHHAAFNWFLAHFSPMIQRLHFVSVLGKDDDHRHFEGHLQTLQGLYSIQKPTTIDLFEGDDAFSGLKQYMETHPAGLLMVQRGTRTLHDQVFRKYLIGELVDHGRIPLVVLPGMG